MYCTFLIPCAACIQEFLHASPHLDNLDLCAFMAVMVSQSIFFIASFVVELELHNWMDRGKYMYTYV